MARGGNGAFGKNERDFGILVGPLLNPSPPHILKGGKLTSKTPFYHSVLFARLNTVKKIIFSQIEHTLYSPLSLSEGLDYHSCCIQNCISFETRAFACILQRCPVRPRSRTERSSIQKRGKIDTRARTMIEGSKLKTRRGKGTTRN